MAERYVTLAEVRDLLTEENASRELLAPQKAAMEHAVKISALGADKARELMEEAVKIPGVTEYTALKIADMLPRHPEDVRAIFSKERVTLDQAFIGAIIGTVGKYL
ncbi:MAG: hypothetical protein LBG62_00540 [Candidatus Methanoplasma sp.]|jgi:DNA-directed RNA polymerase subunit F|nr:hypothetical protein [Candidatus Methanoplasma sp.]